MRARGSITIYLSLTLILMLALLFTLLESARVRGLQVDADRMTQAAAESVFAEYSRALLEDYDLFFLDGGYGLEDFTIDNVSSRMLSFLETNAEPAESSGGLQLNFFQLEPEEANIESYRLVTDDGCLAYYEMACAYAQSALPAAALSSLLSLLTGSTDTDTDSDTDESLSELEEALEALEDEGSYSEEVNADLTDEDIAAAAEVSEETKGILETVSEWKAKGILSLLVEDADALSAQSVSASSLMSGRTLEEGTDEEESDGSGSRLLFQWYLGEKLTSFLDEASEDHALQYELEYCYAGKDSDLENLEAAAEAILLLREGVNYAYLLTDTEKTEEARIVALAIAGIFAVPALLTVIQHAVLLAWAFLESVKDVQILLAGDTVPLVKTSSTWQTTLQVSSVTDQDASGTSGGLTYENYLQILLLTRKESVLIERSLDLIEQNVRLTEGCELFQIDHCIAAASWTVAWSASPMFLSLTSLDGQRQISEYAFVSEGSFQYE